MQGENENKKNGGSKFRVLLEHVPNPDIRAGGYWSNIERPEAIFVEVGSLAQASLTCREYIMEYDLGAGNWAGGKVIDENGNHIAQISFNGNISSPDSKTNSQPGI